MQELNNLILVFMLVLYIKKSIFNKTFKCFKCSIKHVINIFIKHLKGFYEII